MNIKEIKEIVALMNDNEINEFIIEREGFKLAIKKGALFDRAQITTPAPAPQPVPSPAQAAAGAAEDVSAFIVSPMVGTFYSAPSPDTPPFVQVGREVDEDTVVCIIEAMKVMNEIKAERKGKIMEVLAENGDPVEFGKRLFRIG